MKIIHCADVHLDSAFTFLDKQKAKERRAEILLTFSRIFSYARENGIRCILIAGDLFDTRQAGVLSRNRFRQLLTEYPEIQVYYLRGNHDTLQMPEESDVPENLHLFGPDWTRYTLQEGNGKRITLYGRETGENAGTEALPVPDREDFNIVMLHGQTGTGPGEIHPADYRNKGIDYMALGHIHTFRQERLDARGLYCYCGCLEGRGYDECGEKGFVVLEADEKTGSFRTVFQPFAKRCIHEVPVDLTGAEDSEEAARQVSAALQSAAIPESDLVRVLLRGRLPVDAEISPEYLQKRFADSFYDLRIENKTGYQVDYRNFVHDMSLKGEFVRTVQADPDLTEEEAAEVIRIGMGALSGEEFWNAADSLSY